VIPFQVGPGSAAVGRVDIVVAVADVETVRKIAALVDRPETLRIIGRAILLSK
jgi:hypothetical protein